MRVGIIGAGNVGRAIASAAIRAGHSVIISSHKYEDAQKVAEETGADQPTGLLARTATC
jgi:predicted dinucleotide-binding enzyme